jgi:hypothetical protein
MVSDLFGYSTSSVIHSCRQQCQPCALLLAKPRIQHERDSLISFLTFSFFINQFSLDHRFTSNGVFPNNFEFADIADIFELQIELNSVLGSVKKFFMAVSNASA